MRRPVPLLFACLAVLTGCHAGIGHASESEGLLVVLVRHAETAADGTRDPGLSERGRNRAADLARRLAPLRVRAVYASELRRAQETAAPTARQEGTDVRIVPYGAGPLRTYVERLEAEVRRSLADGRLQAGDAVLVVGHSNTTPALAEALLGHRVPPIAEDEYDRIIGILLRPDGTATLAPRTLARR